MHSHVDTEALRLWEEDTVLVEDDDKESGSCDIDVETLPTALLDSSIVSDFVQLLDTEVELVYVCETVTASLLEKDVVCEAEYKDNEQN